MVTAGESNSLGTTDGEAVRSYGLMTSGTASKGRSMVWTEMGGPLGCDCVQVRARGGGKSGEVGKSASVAEEGRVTAGVSA